MTDLSAIHEGETPVEHDGEFVAIKSYYALMNQAGVAAPVATVLQNSVGAIVWTYLANGEYVCTLAGAFLVGKYFCAGSIFREPLNGDTIGIYCTRIDDDSVMISGQNITQAQSLQDDALVNAPLEIRIFP